MTSPFKILVLDDEHEAADMLCALLSAYLPEAEIQAVYTGEAALAVMIERQFDAAVLDLEMKGLGGEGAASAIRSAQHGTAPLLIALSGNLLRLAELRTANIFDHLLSKPVDAAVLLQLLKARA